MSDIGGPVFGEEFKKELKDRLEKLKEFMAAKWPLGMFVFVIFVIIALLFQIILSVLNTSL